LVFPCDGLIANTFLLPEGQFPDLNHVQVQVVVCRSRLGEDSLHDRAQRCRIVGRDHDSEAVETGSITLHQARGDHPRQGGGYLMWTARRVEDVHQELPTDVDSREPGVLFLG
jgi:hypothetical protein